MAASFTDDGMVFYMQIENTSDGQNYPGNPVETHNVQQEWPNWVINN